MDKLFPEIYNKGSAVDKQTSQTKKPENALLKQVKKLMKPVSNFFSTKSEKYNVSTNSSPQPKSPTTGKGR